MRKAVLFLLLIFAALQASADEGYGYISVHKTDGQVDSIAVNGIYDITHSKTDLQGKDHDDFVTMVISTRDGERRYAISDIVYVITPEPAPMEAVTLGTDITSRKLGPRKIIFNGRFPTTETVPWSWEKDEDVYIHMNVQDTVYVAHFDSLLRKEVDGKIDTTRAMFKTVMVETRETPMYVYYHGKMGDGIAHNQVKISEEQHQLYKDDNRHLSASGDCGAAEAHFNNELGVYWFDLNHYPTYFTFLAHCDRVPSIQLKSVTMETYADFKTGKQYPLAGTFSYNYPGDGREEGGIDQTTVKSVEEGGDASSKVTLYTDFFKDKDAWVHLPRQYSNAQDSTGSYMVVAPWPKEKIDDEYIYFKCTFNVYDTLSRIDTVYTRTYGLKELAPNTIYTINVYVPDTLFSIVDLGLDDIKYAFRNVEAYFEQGPVKFYGGAFAYGESNTKNDYGPGFHNNNYRGGAVQDEFTKEYDAAYQRWGGAWRLMQNLEADSLLKKCKTEWVEYNGTHGALITGPSGKRIFLPSNESGGVENYWSIDRSKKISDFYWIDATYGWHYRDIPIIGLQEHGDSVVYHNKAKFYDPGYARGVIEYSNYIYEGKNYGSLMLLRHVREKEESNGNFSINGIVRAARPWQTTEVRLEETGFIFGTDSATLYYNADADMTWDNGKDSLFIKQDSLLNLGEVDESFRPVEGKHLKLVDGAKTVRPYREGQQPIRVELSGESFLGFLDKEQKYYVREYFVSDGIYYYATKATPLSGFFPHTTPIDWKVEMEDHGATLNGKVVGVSSEIPGKVGFIVQTVHRDDDKLLSDKKTTLCDSIYHNMTLAGSQLLLSDPFVNSKGELVDSGEIKTNMTFSHHIKRLENKYYFVKAVFISFSEVDGVKDTTCVLAPETMVLHPLDTLSLGLSSKWVNLNLNVQYPESPGGRQFAWNCDTTVNKVITDIAGTIHDPVFRDWYGKEGWLYTSPTPDQLQVLIDSCDFEPVKRFDQLALKVTANASVNGKNHTFYIPYYHSGWYDHSPHWTSQRPWKDMSHAYYGGHFEDKYAKNLTDIRSQLWIRPVMQISHYMDDNTPLFVSTDTLGMSADRSHVELWGRVLGITKELKGKTVQRGFILNDYYGGTMKDPVTDIMPDYWVEKDTVKTDEGEYMLDEDGHYTFTDSLINGLYRVKIPDNVIAKLSTDREYWYRAYIKVGEEVFYGIPKKLSPLTISVDSILWEVHENKATLVSLIQGTVFAGHKKRVGSYTDSEGNTTTDGVIIGFVTGKERDFDYDYTKADQKNVYKWLYTMADDEEIEDGNYRAVMDVPKDTVYWVRAFIISDNKPRYSEPRQFGLDYVDMGTGTKTMWANISVGSAYPEDDCDYFAIGEPWKKDHYQEMTYVDDTIKSVYISQIKKAIPTTTQTKDTTLTVKSNHGDKYQMRYIGAVHEYFECNEPSFWKHYTGTRNDAAFRNWEYRREDIVEDMKKAEGSRKFIDNKTYGDLFVEPTYQEWKELTSDKFVWKYEQENGVSGWRVTSTVNGNSLFLPFKGIVSSNYRYDNAGGLQWDDNIVNATAGFYHVSDSILSVSINATRPLTSGFDSPLGYSWDLSWSEFYKGLTVRPIARWTHQLTTDQDKLRDNTLMYLTTDSATYLNHRTAVVLQGTYRINLPLESDKYKLGFVVKDCNYTDRNNIGVNTTGVINIELDETNHHLSGSQHFVALDSKDNLKGDQTYFYRFYIYRPDAEEENRYIYADADSFHLARITTGTPDWKMYTTQATLHGTIEGIMPADNTSGFKAGILVGYNRDLKAGDDPKKPEGNSLVTPKKDPIITNIKDLGDIKTTFTLAKDTTYYFRAYAYYNGTYHYGDVNLFGYELIDLGLPSKKRWASINVGGRNPFNGVSQGLLTESFGVYGENSSSPNRPHASQGAGGPSDKAHTQWHNVNRMPYYAEMKELLDNCDWKLDTIYGIPVTIFTSRANGKKIYFRSNITYDRWSYCSDYALSYEQLHFDHTTGKPSFPHLPNQSVGCRGIRFLRPVWESTDTLSNGDEIMIRTDGAFVHDPVDNVTFFGSVLGTTQQHMLKNDGEPYTVSSGKAGTTTGDLYAGFVVGSDTLTTHANEYFIYDFPQDENGKKVEKDSIFYHTTANINLFKMKDVYWVRAYVKIGNNYYYGRSIKFDRNPKIETGDVEWGVGQQKARVYGSVKGFNNNILDMDKNVGSGDTELTSMEDLAKNARVGIIVAYKDNPEVSWKESDPDALDQVYDLAQAQNGTFWVDIDYKKDTTYYYRAYIKYNDEYHYADLTNHFGLEFVDLGLPMQWASINVGARYAEDNSQQFAWGDTVSSPPFKFANYRYYYDTGDDEYNNLGNEIKGSLHDVAHVKWTYTWDTEEYGARGALWAMPSEDDLQMLVDSCTWVKETSHRFNGKTNVDQDGYRVTGKNGNSIFISNIQVKQWTMSGGSDYNGGPFDYGPLWTSSRAPKERNAYGMMVGKDAKDAKELRLLKYHYRYHGHFVRPMAHINVTLPSGKKLSIMTERTSWTAGAESATIYGCVLGLNESTKGSYGFVIGSSAENLESGKSGVQTVEVKKNTSEVGLFKHTIADLNNNRMYYFRSYVEIDGKKYYGEVKEFGIVMVDLGLTSGTKWANVNMGAWKEKDHGDYYAWGEVGIPSVKDVFTLDGYQYYNTLTGAYNELGVNISGNDTTDVASKKLGGAWRMAGDEEWDELIKECDWKADTVGHVPGYRVTGKNGKSIFLPSNYYNAEERDTNYEYGTSEDSNKYALNHDNEETHLGYYWSSNRALDYTKAREVSFDNKNDSKGTVNDSPRWRGNGIRAVARDGIYLRTEGTDWRYQKDSVNFYVVALSETSFTDKDEVGVVIGNSNGVTLTTDGALKVEGQQSKSARGSHDFVATISKGFYKDDREKGFDMHDGIYYYRAYVKKEGQDPIYGDARQFGLQEVDLGTPSLQWANINVDASSPEEFGLNGIPSGKYATGDPAFVEFGGIWRTPTDTEKQLLLDENNFEWVADDGSSIGMKYGINLWKVKSKIEGYTDKYIYLTSKDPASWGVRAVSQYNVSLPDDQKLYLRTDSTSWRAGYAGNELYATLVGKAATIAGIQERGFVLGTTADLDKLKRSEDQEGDDKAEVTLLTATAEQVKTSGYEASMGALPVGTHYYRAYIKYDNVYYYAEEALPVGIEFIDLGLPSGVKWANVNVGATVASDTGDKYAWGETEVKDTYTQSNYAHYNALTGYKDIGADISSNSTYDAATSKIDGTRMPSKTELDELRNATYCTWASATVNGVQGYTVTSKVVGYEGQSIFLPAGDYWTSTQLTSNIANAHIARNNNTTNVARYYGNMIRPVSSLITTTDATEIDKDNATLNGIVSVSSYGAGVEVGFQFTPSSQGFAAGDNLTVSVSKSGAYKLKVSELTEGNLYFFRAYVKTADGVYHYGNTKTFATKSTKSDNPSATAPGKVDVGMNSDGVTLYWGDRNVLADLPETEGEFYAWGELVIRGMYNTTTYTHNVNNKYIDIGKNISATEYDIANRTFKGCWRMPTQAEMTNLINGCWWTWGTKEGVPGYWVENKTTHDKVFLPAAGYKERTYHQKDQTEGHYWAATTDNTTNGNANRLYFHATGKSANNSVRYYGFTVRPVYQTNLTLDDQDLFIRADSVSYAADYTSNTIYATMLGLNSAEDGLEQGFIIGPKADIELSDDDGDDDDVIRLKQDATANGQYSLVLGDDNLQKLYVGKDYYVRAYVKHKNQADSDAGYSNAIKLEDHTFFTDSVVWGLGNQGKLYGHIKGRKPEGLTVGFKYSYTDLGVKSAEKTVNASWSAEDDKVFIATIDTVKVGIYSYAATTRVNLTDHQAATKTFGAKTVDMGLTSGVKWVSMNLGASDEKQKGDAYKWGATKPGDAGTAATDRTFIGGTSYDAAHTRLGTMFRLPSPDNVQELLDNCKWEWTTEGYVITSNKNGNRIFLPATNYWTSLQGTADGSHATILKNEESLRGLSDGSVTPHVERIQQLLMRPVNNPVVDVAGDSSEAGKGEIGESYGD